MNGIGGIGWRVGFACVACLASSCATTSGAQSSAPPNAAAGNPSRTVGPVWERELVAFSTVDVQAARPWRSDPRLAARFHSKEYADDIEVMFFAPGDRARAETMWV